MNIARTLAPGFSLQISDQGECRGRFLLVTFLGEARKVTAVRHEQLVAKIALHATSPVTLTLSRKGRGARFTLRGGLRAGFPPSRE